MRGVEEQVLWSEAAGGRNTRIAYQTKKHATHHLGPTDKDQIADIDQLKTKNRSRQQSVIEDQSKRAGEINRKSKETTQGKMRVALSHLEYPSDE